MKLDALIKKQIKENLSPLEAEYILKGVKKIQRLLKIESMIK